MLKPSVGDHVVVTSDWSNFFRPFAANVPRTYVTKGKVVESEGHDSPDTIRLFTGDPEFPYSVVQLSDKVTVTYDDGSTNSYESTDEEHKESWQVKGSTGSYTVSRIGTQWSCSCKGFMFRGSCKHINQKKKELLNAE